MKNVIKIFSLMTSILLLLSSCQAVYDVELTAPETTVNPEIDLAEEYYTTGMPYMLGNATTGILYEGCLIYIEKCTTTGIVGERTSADGEKTPIYGDLTVDRLVKYNPVTGTVSSPCLDPACNHSLESGCPMLLGYGMRSDEVYTFQGLCGDWVIYLSNKFDDEYTIITTETMYNLKTGETRKVFVEDLGSEVLSRWSTGLYYDGKYYKVNNILDFSNTGYKPGEGKPIFAFEPVTKRILYEYDFETDKSKELFAIGNDWYLAKITNERFYFGKESNGKMVSIKKDGTDERKEVAIITSNLVGTYTMDYNVSDGYTVHNLKTNEIKEVKFDYSTASVICVTEKGVLSACQTTYDEWKEFNINKYIEEHPGVTKDEANNVKRKILASGSAQIWQCDYMGEDNHVIFELPAAKIDIIAAYGDFIYAKVTKYNSETGKALDEYQGKPCSINIKTGEVMPIPQLDIVVPYWYVN